MTLSDIALELTCDKGPAFHNYTPAYASYLDKWRDERISTLEIGTQFWCSTRMWLRYFTKADHHGIDVWECPTDKPTDRFTFHQCDQRNNECLKNVVKSMTAPFMVCIDDGCHDPDAVRISFETLWPLMAPGAVYIAEDLHSWHHPQWHQNGAGHQWMQELFNAVNWSGKCFHGNPTPGPYTLTLLERTLERVDMYKGTAILTKRLVEAA